ncbi:hypothetical protein OG357_13875 [Streptomyces sp. NBC_01255]|uniref:hypothetical protein n=1 Tax=Streptomyces sp. NBC_01255 TaxID=2903798 RepID=UPI002E340FAB|nr:hypothetical protein [Streptomyces sp. NBC_01255]
MPRWAVVMLWVVGALVVLVPVGGIGAYIYAVGENHENMRFPSEDVTVARCAVDPVSKRPVAELSVTSQAGRRGSYTVTVEFQDEREKAVERGFGVVEDLADGGTGRTVVMGAEAYEQGVPRCVVYEAGFRATEPTAGGTP